MTVDVAIAVAHHLWGGLLVTLQVSVLSLLLATVLGVALGAASQSENPATRMTVRCYVELFRGIPSLLILLFVFFALPQVGLVTGPIISAILGLGLWGSAGIAEVMRGALVSISIRQVEGARALGMSGVQAMLHVLVPQAFRRFLPSYVGQLTQLIQASVLTTVVGVTDLLGSARQMIEQLAYLTGNSHAVEIYGAVLATFFALCYPLSWLSRRLELASRSAD